MKPIQMLLVGLIVFGAIALDGYSRACSLNQCTVPQQQDSECYGCLFDLEPNKLELQSQPGQATESQPQQNERQPENDS